MVWLVPYRSLRALHCVGHSPGSSRHLTVPLSVHVQYLNIAHGRACAYCMAYLQYSRWLLASHGESYRAGHSVCHPVASVPQIVVLVHKYSKHSGSPETASYLQAVCLRMAGAFLKSF